MDPGPEPGQIGAQDHEAAAVRQPPEAVQVAINTRRHRPPFAAADRADKHGAGVKTQLLAPGSDHGHVAAIRRHECTPAETALVGQVVLGAGLDVTDDHAGVDQFAGVGGWPDGQEHLSPIRGPSHPDDVTNPGGDSLTVAPGGGDGPQVSRQRSGLIAVGVVADFERFVVALFAGPLDWLIFGEKREALPVGSPSKLGYAAFGVGDSARLAAFEREDEQLGLLVGLAIDEREPVAARRPFDRADIATAGRQLPGGAGGDVDRVERALESVVGVVGAGDDHDEVAAVR